MDSIYGGYIFNALRSVYPNYEWLPWKFKQKLPQGYWNKKENQKKFLDNITKELGFVNIADWYHITQKGLHEFGGATLLHKYNGSPYMMLQSVYPDYDWDKQKFNTMMS